MQKIHNKLVRDRIPEIIEKDGRQCQIQILSLAKYQIELRKKLMEEAREAAEANTRRDLIQELADLAEVMEAVMHTEQITEDELFQAKTKKAAANGKFAARIFLKSVSDA